MADAAALQMRAERELGRLLLAAEQAGQIKTGRPRKAALQNGSSEEPFSRVTLAEVGISKKLSAKAQRAAGLPEEAFEAMVADMCERVRGAGAIIVDPLAAAEKEAERGARREAHRKRSLQGGTVMDLHALAASGFRAKTILADPRGAS